jgi:hypothetical protein
MDFENFGRSKFFVKFRPDLTTTKIVSIESDLDRLLFDSELTVGIYFEQG